MSALRSMAAIDGLPFVSILIVNYNGRKVLGACLNSLRLLEYPGYEVIVVDNASTDGSVELLTEHPNARLIQAPSNLGFAGGNNLGLPSCQGEFVLLLNSDTIVTPHSLSR